MQFAGIWFMILIQSAKCIPGGTATRDRAISICFLSTSPPMNRRLSFSAASPVVPVPRNGSTTKSPGSLRRSTSRAKPETLCYQGPNRLSLASDLTTSHIDFSPSLGVGENKRIGLNWTLIARCQMRASDAGVKYAIS
jgi:hypothetical protein